MPCRRLVIAGTHSGVGKTTVALGLMAALRQRGLVVQPFKVGPDFIDPGHHTAVCGRTSHNLDSWMLPGDYLRHLFQRHCAGADVAVIEGVMGLFDGCGPDDPRGSSADVARLLDVPVLLVVDAAGLAASIAAVVKGFCDFDPAVRVAGVICNGVAGGRHYEYLEPAIRTKTCATPLGWLPHRTDWAIPERHLGLTTIEDWRGSAARWEQLGKAFAAAVDLDQVLALAQESIQSLIELPFADCRLPNEKPAILRRLAVARDAAFCFYYPDNLDLLHQAGAEIVPFSPLTDAALPERTDVLYLGGGYPELNALQLSENRTMRESIRRFHHEGGVIYAECGGLMYCGRELVGPAGRGFVMLDLLPLRTVMQPKLAALGYLKFRTVRPTPLGPAGVVARGHEFHYSRLEALAPLDYAAEVENSRGERRPEGIVSGNLLASYAHLHFGSNPAVAAHLAAGVRSRSAT